MVLYPDHIIFFYKNFNIKINNIIVAVNIFCKQHNIYGCSNNFIVAQNKWLL